MRICIDGVKSNGDGMSSLFDRGGVDEGLSTADGWVYESHNQAPLLDNPGGGYIRGKYTRVCCNPYAPEQTKAVFWRTKEELSWPLSEQAACGWVIGNAWINLEGAVRTITSWNGNGAKSRRAIYSRMSAKPGRKKETRGRKSVREWRRS